MTPGISPGLRSLLAWYPDDIWWWMLACQWERLAQEESFMQRTAEVGDETGSAIVTARLVRDVMRLALLVARRYAPYQKWFGTAFSRLDDPEGLGEQLAAALSGTSLRQREDALGAAYQILAGRFNALARTWTSTRHCGRSTTGRLASSGRAASRRRLWPRSPTPTSGTSAGRIHRPGRRLR